MTRKRKEKAAAVPPAPSIPPQILVEFTKDDLIFLVQCLEAVKVSGTKAEMVQIVQRIAAIQNKLVDATKS
jgi:hypothetical protein